MSKIVGDAPCPQCKVNGHDVTGNHLILYEDGGSYCNRCSYYSKDMGSFEAVNEEEVVVPTFDNFNPLDLESLPFRKMYRGIPPFVAELFGVVMDCDPETGDLTHSYYPIKKEGIVTGAKVRKHPKTFRSIGDCKGNTELFGIGAASNCVIITGGEEDAMAAYSMLLPTVGDANKYDLCVYSLVHGEQAVKDIANNLEFLNKFEKVILCLDNDGKTKEKEIAKLLGAKAYIMTFSEKDANDMLIADKQKEFISAFWKAELYKPDTILWASDIMDKVYQDDQESEIRYPFTVLDKMLGGMRKGELVTFCAGTGVGKSTAIHHIILGVLDKWKVGTVCLEEAPVRTLKNMRIVAGLPEQEDFNLLTKDRLMMRDSFGCASIESISDSIRYMAGAGIDMVVLDHISMMVADVEEDERRALDRIMTRLRTLVQELEIHLVVVCHLRRAAGDSGYEDGKQVSLSALRSSASIGQLSDAVVAMERKVSDDDDSVKNTVKLRVLKNRFLGSTGGAGKLKYEEGRLKEIEIYKE